MMKKISLVLAIIFCFMAFAALPASAESNEKEVLRYTPVIDGQLDAAYLQSLVIEHEFPVDHNSKNYWIGGRWAWTDIEYDEDGAQVDPDAIGSITPYGFDIRATSYFLWDDDYLYIAVVVVDDDFGVIDDEHYAMAAADTGNLGPWFQDSVQLIFSFEGMHFHILADAAGRFFSTFREANYHEDVWIDNIHSWFEHTLTNDEGHFATRRTGNGYIIEARLQIQEDGAIKEDIIDNDYGFLYGISVCDSPAGSTYALDQALLAQGERVEGYQFSDFAMYNDRHPEDANGKYEVHFSQEEAVVNEDEPAIVQPEGGSEGGGNVSPGTSDAGLAFAAVALVAAAGAVALRKRSR